MEERAQARGCKGAPFLWWFFDSYLWQAAKFRQQPPPATPSRPVVTAAASATSILWDVLASFVWREYNRKLGRRASSSSCSVCVAALQSSSNSSTPVLRFCACSHHQARKADGAFIRAPMPAKVLAPSRVSCECCSGKLSYIARRGEAHGGGPNVWSPPAVPRPVDGCWPGRVGLHRSIDVALYTFNLIF